MSKYDEQFKLAVVEQYLSGFQGYREIANEHGITYSLVKRWVGWYRAHGSDGLKKKHSHYSAPFKLSVLQHMWNNALSYHQAAMAFNIRNPGILSVWECHYRSTGYAALIPRPRGRTRPMIAPTTKPAPLTDDKQRPRDDLLAELQHLRMENAYLKKLQALVQAQQKAAPRKKHK